jgi:neutral ceramidase
VFLNGACGDVTQVDNLSRDRNRQGEDMSRFTGARVGAEAVKVMVSEARGELKPVAAATKTLPLKRRPLSQERVAECRRIVEEGLKQEKTNTTEWIFAKEIVVLDYLMGRTPVVETEVQAIQVGPAVFLANPAEYFCQLGLDIKKGSPFAYTYVVELANGCIGYVPTEDAFLPSGGGYETVLTSYSNLEITAGRKLVGASLELARTLNPGAVPERQKAEPVREAWSYGVLGPDV